MNVSSNSNTFIRSLRLMQSKKMNVNAMYEHEEKSFPEFKPKDSRDGSPSQVHSNSYEWDTNLIQESIDRHCLMTWGASNPMKDMAIHVVRGEGSYLFDDNGKKYLDFSSQAMCSNLGHSIQQEIRAAILEQLDALPMVFGDALTTPIRAKMCHLLSEVFPSDIDAFMFPSSGAEANEVAIRIARLYTGKHKILSRHRSYHGGTMGSLSLTGDNRRWYVDNGVTGFIKMADPFPQYYQYASNPEESIEKCLLMLHDQIINEGPHTCAAIIVEPITGTNGWLKAPPRYLQGLRALCDEYNILLICDEVMAGFGRTGKMFSFQHSDGVVPDIVTFAKGVTGAYLPLSGVGIRNEIAHYFDDKPIGYGSTYQAHPVALACGYEVVKYIIDNNLVEKSQSFESLIFGEMEKLAEKHSCIKQSRISGMGGCIDICDENGDFICGYNEVSPKMVELRRSLISNGLSTMIRGHLIHVAPPLTSTVDDIKLGFQIMDQSLTEVFGN